VGVVNGTTDDIRIDWFTGDRALLRASFEQAEDSRVQLDAYIDQGRVLAAWRGDTVVGHLQLIGGARAGECEVKNMAVGPDLRGKGIGRRLVDRALATARADGLARVVVATATADVGNLRFYQRCGFRFVAVEPDAFTADTGYPEPIVIDGIPLRDRIWLAQDL
jgi:N-acetylglutamate synthase-like GNAT family acetyltransferase